MKNLFFVVLLCLGFAPMATAQDQNTNATTEDYRRLIKNHLEVDFRTFALESMELTQEEIIAFDPIYSEYMDAKSELMAKKRRLVAEYEEEMQEDDSQEDKTDETADFIENFWELKIDEMELRKDYFDGLEDKIGPIKAANFFLLEEAVYNRLQQQQLVTIMPSLAQLNRAPKSLYTHGWRNSIEGFQSWMMQHDGEVTLDHHYTSTGLKKLVHAIDALSRAHQVNLPDYDMKKQKVMTLISKLRQNPMSDEHADMTSEAFVMTADLLSALQQHSGSTDVKNHTDAVKTAASAINPDVLLTEQAQHVHDFFNHAQEAVNAMASKINWEKPNNVRSNR